MLTLYDQVQEAKRFIQSRWAGTPRAGIILGTGLGGLVDDIQAEASLAYGDIPHFPPSTALSTRANWSAASSPASPSSPCRGAFTSTKGIL